MMESSGRTETTEKVMEDRQHRVKYLYERRKGKILCKRNLAKYKMVRTNRGLVCEVDRSEEEKAQRGRSEDKYNKHTHVGQKIVEASLIPSHKVSNNEANKARILRHIHGQGHKIASVKNSGDGRLDLFFNGYQEANKCLKDKGMEGGEVFITFTILDRSTRCKGIITGWDMQTTLDELVESMVVSDNIIEIEILKENFR